MTCWSSSSFSSGTGLFETSTDGGVDAKEAVDEEGDGGRGTEAVDEVDAEEPVAEEGGGGRGAEAVDSLELT